MMSTSKPHPLSSTVQLDEQGEEGEREKSTTIEGNYTQKVLKLLGELLEVLNNLNKKTTQTETETESNQTNSNKDKVKRNSLLRRVTEEFKDVDKLLKVLKYKHQVKLQVNEVVEVQKRGDELTYQQICSCCNLFKSVLNDLGQEEGLEPLFDLVEQTTQFNQAHLPSHTSKTNTNINVNSNLKPMLPWQLQKTKTLRTTHSSQNLANLTLPHTNTVRTLFLNPTLAHSSPDLKLMKKNSNFDLKFHNTVILDSESEEEGSNLDEVGLEQGLGEVMEFDEPFATSIDLGNPFKCGSGLKSFTLYTCTATTPKGTKYTLAKRYSDFDKLRTQFLKLYPKYAPFLPRLPPKKVLGKFDPKFVEQRRQGLLFFLQFCTLHPILGKSPIVQRFFQGN